MGNFVKSYQDSSNQQQQFSIVKIAENSLTLLLEKSTQNEFALKQFNYQSKQEFQKNLDMLERKKKMKHNHLLKIKNIFTKVESNFCSDIFKIFVILEYPFRTLLEEVQQRINTFAYFKENQLWSILYSCILASKYLYDEQKIKHQCFIDSRIYIHKQGLIQICDPSILGYNTNRNTFFVKDTKSHIYLSPQQIEFVENSKLLYSSQHSDIFTLGMIILECANLKFMEEVYQCSFTKINKQKIKNQIENTKARYSPHLQNILERMLKIQPSERITLNQIEKFIRSTNLDSQMVANTNQTNRSKQKQLAAPIQSIRNIEEQKIIKRIHKPDNTSYMQATKVYAPKIEQNLFAYSFGDQNFSNSESVPSSNYFINKKAVTKPYIPQFNTNLNKPYYYHQYNTSTKSVNFKYLSNQTLSNFKDTNQNINLPANFTYNPNLNRQLNFQIKNVNYPVQNTNILNTQNLSNKIIPAIQQSSRFVNEDLPDGSRYQGSKLNGLRHGFGKLQYQNRTYYQGEWKNNIMDGFGNLFQENSNLIYKGYWKNNVFQGRGKLFNNKIQNNFESVNYKNLNSIGNTWQYFDGEFDSGQKQGQGTLKFANGQIFQGKFFNNKASGKGRFIRLNGQIIDGVWQENEQIT